MRGVALFFVIGSVAMVVLGLKWGVLAHVMALDAEPVWRSSVLLGWAVLALCGAWYHVAPRQAETRLAQAHLALGAAGAALMLTGAAWTALAPMAAADAVETVGGVLIVSATAILLFNIVGARRVEG
ncbi:hypothetical protein [Rubrimonas cliftonensis]|uniref:Uncharacterized protein n=1 Tax=Rubrimonas cliftonensis TaxID=89524 RepID=A0A1H3VQV4_9RHOB|nr:hypothetical protein [Rubrimonas cliftonensis]SDZ77195.1 hypothetical protein SAMN05444370_101271 [Rubrimonas cliftonensis]